MHRTFIDANWDEFTQEWFDVGCNHCGFSSLGLTSFEAATREAVAHERFTDTLTPVTWFARATAAPWFRRGRG